MDVNEILETIKGLSLKSILAYLVGKGISDFSQKGYGKIKELILNKQRESKYLFVPNKREVIKLKDIERDPQYRELELLVPNYKYLDYIRTGILLRDYRKNPTEGDDARRSQIKIQITKRPGGNRLRKIVNLPDSDFFPAIVDYLYKLKINGYSENHLKEEFEDLVNVWEESSLHVRNRMEKDYIKNWCRGQAEKHNDRFFLLATKGAVENVEKAVEHLEKENFFRENFYKFKITRDGDEEHEQIQVIVYTKDLK